MKKLNLFVSNAWSWLRYIGWMYALGILIVGLIVSGMISLALANPIVKLSFAVGGIVTYNLAGAIANLVYDETKEKSKIFGYILGFIVVLTIPVTIYSLIVCATFLPWYVNLVIVTHLVTSAFIALHEERARAKIPAIIIWLRNIIFFFTLYALSQHLYFAILAR